MSVSVRLDEIIVSKAQVMAKVESRSLPKQVEHWVRIGQMVEDNPDLPYAFIREALLAKAELENGEVTKYERRKR